VACKEEDKPIKKVKTVNMKRKEKMGRGVWLGTSSLTLENPEDQKVVRLNHNIP
jgi:predicted RNA-binding protein YlxR (DUF448 family)